MARVLSLWRHGTLAGGLVLILLAIPVMAQAQVCRTGKPCGNTCIARDRVCRVSPGTARSGGTPTPTPAPSRSAPSSSQATAPTDAVFAASSRGQVYYWVGCSAWRDLAPANLRFFRTRAEAEAAGYRVSGTRGCGGPPDAVDSTLANAAFPGGAFARPPGAPCTVRVVIDGDTLDCTDGRRIRLLLIDAPEMAQSAYGALAKQALEGLAPVGATLGVELDVQVIDPYDRTLAHLYDAQSVSINRQLLALGVAVVEVYPPNVRHVDQYRETVEEARNARRGLWALDAFACTPADFRSGSCPADPR